MYSFGIFHFRDGLKWPEYTELDCNGPWWIEMGRTELKVHQSETKWTEIDRSEPNKIYKLKLGCIYIYIYIC